MEEITQAQVVPPNESVTGDLRLHEFHSRVFRNTRMLRVWLPPRYDAPGNASRRYSVLYLNDGQNLFDRATAFAGVEWQVDETADRLIRQEVIPPLIIVGIDNAQSDRFKEYVPYPSFHPPILRPRGKRYPDFLMNEVMPFVASDTVSREVPKIPGWAGRPWARSFRCTPSSSVRRVFGHLLLESPSLFISHRRILKYSRLVRQWPEKVFLAIGTREAGHEDKDKQVVEDVRALERSLRRADLDDRRLLVKIDEGAGHNESEWAKRFPEALRFLFGKVDRAVEQG